MADRIHALLLIPADGDPHGLLAPAVRGYGHPPMARCGTVYRGGVTLTRWNLFTAGGQALVLAWDGQPVPEGCDRADWRRPGANDGYPSRSIYPETARLLMWARQGDELSLAGAVQELRRLTRDLGTLLALDADGREVAL